MGIFFFFFFSSRRRHTRLTCDWSSDVCSSDLLGPFGQYFAPLMIGSKRMAFPRIEAIGFWLTPAAYIILLSGVLLGGFPTGWTGYAPLNLQATEGMDAYAVAFGIMGI